MNSISMLAMVEAGHIKENDNVLGLMQGLSIEQAETVADWLALATRGPVALQYISLEGTTHITRSGHDDPTIKITKPEGQPLGDQA